jgi:predicted AAA+ superfamily ATPase
MITEIQLSEIIKDQQEIFLKKNWIERHTEIPLQSKRIIIISGVRRCGKSTLLKQKLLKTNKAIYVNFEDPRLPG